MHPEVSLVDVVVCSSSDLSSQRVRAMDGSSMNKWNIYTCPHSSSPSLIQPLALPLAPSHQNRGLIQWKGNFVDEALQRLGGQTLRQTSGPSTMVWETFWKRSRGRLHRRSYLATLGCISLGLRGKIQYLDRYWRLQILPLLFIF